MTELLEKAFQKAAEKLPDYEQDALGTQLLAMIETDDQQWDAAFARSTDKLAVLANHALQEYYEGRTEPLDLDKL